MCSKFFFFLSLKILPEKKFLDSVAVHLGAKAKFYLIVTFLSASNSLNSVLSESTSRRFLDDCENGLWNYWIFCSTSQSPHCAHLVVFLAEVHLAQPPEVTEAGQLSIDQSHVSVVDIGQGHAEQIANCNEMHWYPRLSKYFRILYLPSCACTLL